MTASWCRRISSAKPQRFSASRACRSRQFSQRVRHQDRHAESNAGQANLAHALIVAYCSVVTANTSVEQDWQRAWLQDFSTQVIQTVSGPNSSVNEAELGPDARFYGRRSGLGTRFRCVVPIGFRRLLACVKVERQPFYSSVGRSAADHRQRRGRDGRAMTAMDFRAGHEKAWSVFWSRPLIERRRELGQPVPLLNLVVEGNRGWRNRRSSKDALAVLLSSGLVPARSVPCSRSTRNCAGTACAAIHLRSAQLE